MTTHGVAAAIIVDDGKVFAAERGYGNYRGFWEFPGGKVEPGESPEQALTRELREELACTVHINSLFCKVAHDYPEYRIEMRCYLCTLDGTLPQLLEHDDARWLDASTIASVNWLESDWAVVDALIRQGVVR